TTCCLRRRQAGMSRPRCCAEGSAQVDSVALTCFNWEAVARSWPLAVVVTYVATFFDRSEVEFHAQTSGADDIVEIEDQPAVVQVPDAQASAGFRQPRRRCRAHGEAQMGGDAWLLEAEPVPQQQVCRGGAPAVRVVALVGAPVLRPELG